MKKSLVALAVLASFGGAAFAQSSVTLYGLVDQGIQKTNGGTAANEGTVAGAAGKAWQLRQSASSRLGFRGNEDMGGGLSAQFQIEHRFEPDTGAESVAGRFWHGRSWVQLTKAGLGSINLGRQYLPTFWVQLKADPFGWDGVGQIGGMQNAGFAAQGGGSSIRASNAVTVKSANFGGLSFEGQIGLSEGTQAGRNDSFNVIYQGGPLFVGFGMAKVNGGPATVNDNELITLTGAYNLGMAEVAVNWGRAKVGGGRLTNKTGNIGATVNLAGGKLKAAYAIYDPSGGNNKIKKFALGYDYPLSKRTNIYADLGVATEGRGVRAVAPSRNTAYAFGVKHVF